MRIVPRLRRGSLSTAGGRLILVCVSMLMSESLSAADPLAGRYRMAGGPDVASELVLKPDGSFEYFLAAGSLDEYAKGRWNAEGRVLHLTTLPKPVAPVFSARSTATSAEAPLILHVISPNGGGIAAVDLRVGFDSGDPVEGYTQDYGWSLPEQERRTPRWVEFAVPIYQLRSPRFPINLGKGNVLTFVLTPNDIGEVDFTGVRVEVGPRRLIVHRGDASLTFEATGD